MIKKLGKKLAEAFDYLLFLLMFIVMIPWLFASGGVLRIKRWYKYVSATVHHKETKTYKIKY